MEDALLNTTSGIANVSRSLGGPARQQFHPDNALVWDKIQFARYSVRQFVGHHSQLRTGDDEIRVRYAQTFAIGQMQPKRLERSDPNQIPDIFGTHGRKTMRVCLEHQAGSRQPYFIYLISNP